TLGGSTPPQYTGARASLLDLTTGETVWNWGWDFLTSDSPPPWLDRNLGETTVLDVPTALSASDRYRLTMFAESGANDDSQVISVELSGLDAAPEPSNLLLFGAGALAVALRRRSHV